MQRIIAAVGVLGALLFAAIIVPGSGSASAQSQCRANCNRRYNPADVPKEDRWNMDAQRQRCLKKCR